MNYDAINDLIGSEWKYIENDCFAVFRKASKALLGREIPAVALPDISSTDANIAAFKTAMSSDKWQRVYSPQVGDAVYFFSAKDEPIHIGMYVEDGHVLHCPGTPSRPQRTVYEKLSEMNRFIYRRFEYYRPCI